MANVTQLKGVEKMIAHWNRRRQKNLAGLANGLKQAGLILLRASQNIVPVDTGNLKASAFIRDDSQTPEQPAVIVGYTANYAIFVHEDLNALHGEAFNQAYADLIAARKAKRGAKGSLRPFHSRGPQQQAKFLEQPFRELRPQLKEIIRSYMK